MPELLDASQLFAEYAFTNSLPIPDVIDTARRSNITIQVRDFEQFLGLYDDEGNPTSWTREPTILVHDSIEDLRWELEKILQAADKPILDYPSG